MAIPIDEDQSGLTTAPPTAAAPESVARRNAKVRSISSIKEISTGQCQTGVQEMDGRDK